LWPIQAELLSGRDPLFRSITVELTTILVTHLHPFTNNISLDSNAPDSGTLARKSAQPTTSRFGTPCLNLHNATHITQRIKKKRAKGRYSE
jgi:hypothetical protein